MKKNSRSKNRRNQSTKPPKSGNTPYMEAMQELRRSSATARHRSAADYRRKPKHAGKGWD